MFVSFTVFDFFPFLININYFFLVKWENFDKRKKKMPSRAVLRKKHRRDIQKAKAVLNDGVAQVTASSPSPSVVESAVRKRSRAEAFDEVEGKSEEGTDTSRLTRKERHKLETQRRLEREMRRIEAQQSAASRRITVAGEAEAEDAGNAVKVDGAETPSRHDPRFAGGTFWKTRKERRARTVFLGGVPTRGYGEAQIRDLIVTSLEKDAVAAEYLASMGDRSKVVEEVDLLPLRHAAKVRNMYVTLSTVPLAGCLAAVLDGMPIQGKKLRCNFAADKSQRAEAIRRREH